MQPFLGTWKFDGEIIYLNAKGQEEFTPQQRRCRTEYPDQGFIRENPVKLVLWDQLEDYGESIELKPYIERKEALREWFTDEEGVLQEPYNSMPEQTVNTIKFEPFTEDLVVAWNHAVANDHEGIIIKQKMSAYQHDRTWDWIKVKNWQWVNCNVIGWTEGKNARRGYFGALVLTDPLTGAFAGNAGSGFDEFELGKWKRHFNNSPSMPKPFSDTQVGNPYTAVKTDRQVLVKYYQLTEKAGVFRFPIYCLSNLA